MIGQTISHYRILERLGAGGMGVVYKAEDLRLKRPVALKFLSAELTRDEEAKERFIHEAQAASALDHANLCTVHEIDETPDGQLFLAMACYEGQTLKQRIERGRLGIAEALDIGVQIAQGLACAHESGIVHRDVKPANVMLTSRGEAKIVDFGLAKLMGGAASLTRTGTTLGTVAYMSPEQTRGEEADASSDVWAIGVVLYEMLIGRPPFQGDHSIAVMNAVEHGQPAPIQTLRPEVPDAMCRIVARALEKTRSARYASAAELASELVATRLALTAPAPAGPAPQRPLRQRPAVLAGAGAVVAVAVAAVIGLWVYTGERRIAWAVEQIPEIRRLADEGQFPAAFALAEEVERLIPDDATLRELWPAFSVAVPIRSEPPGARVYRQGIDAPAGDWELLGITPLEHVRFIEGGGYRVRLEADGYRTVELLQTALQGVEWRNLPALNPVRLDPHDVLPERMLRVPGFRIGDVEYGDYLMDRYEVTNREYKAFVDAGGYRSRDYWTERFIDDGREVGWDEAMAAFRDQTGRPGPATWQLGTFPEGQADFPVGGVSWYEAAALARFAGKNLPTTYHWGQAQRFYREDSWIIAPRSNFGTAGPRSVGDARAMNTFGISDMAGNVREWCYNEAGVGRATRGGAWTDAEFHAGWTIPKSPFDRDPTHGIRLLRTFDGENTLARLRTPVAPTAVRNYGEEKPAPDPEYTIFRRLYAYDNTPLNATIEETKPFEHWTREKVAFDLPYGERGGAYLFLPRDAARPLQSVIYWSGSGFARIKSIDDEYLPGFDFIVRSGRAVVVPILKGTLERDPNDRIYHAPGTETESLGYRDVTVERVKDVLRTIDYLATREDLTAEKIAYLGFSWGGGMAPLVLAVETRIKAAVLNVGGLGSNRYLPEVDPFNFTPRVRTPVLMINGEHDIVFPLETAQKPMLDLLGTDPAHKRHYVSRAAHIVPRNELIRETLDWLDRYLGPLR